MKLFPTSTAAALAIAAAVPAAADVATTYSTDFQGDGWSYLWNAPSDWDLAASPVTSDGSTGAITSIADYEPLIESTDNLLTATGSSSFPTQVPSNFLRLTPFNGQPGLGRAQAGSGYNNSVERYAIAAYTVMEDGVYSIVDSTIDRNSGSAGTDDYVNLLVYTDPNSPVLSKQFTDAAGDFNVEVGQLSAGDTIYVAVGADRFATGDFFMWNFSIDVQPAAVPEPTSGAFLLGMGLLAARRRRRL